MLVRALHAMTAAETDEVDQRNWALRHYDHLAACSCWMCGNPRKYRGEPTIQERKHSKFDDRGGRSSPEECP
jgi:hypothetical protein